MWDRYAQQEKFRNITLRVQGVGASEGEGLRRQLEESEQLISEKEHLLTEKEEIISELKEIIRLSNDNNSRVRAKRQEEQELRELRHSVRVLTIENNALSTYIDKLKQGEAAGEQEVTKTLREQLHALREELKMREAAFQNKVDEFIASHKSLAEECRRLQQAKEAAEEDRERAWAVVRELEETQRRPEGRERTGIMKIKEQYAQSVQQIRDTIQIQVETQFDAFASSFAILQTRLSALQRRIQLAEQQLFGRSGRNEIYIQEGQEGQQRVRMGLHEEVCRLRQMLADLQGSERQHYTFREQEETTQRERELISQVDGLREEIDRLQSAYRQEQAQTTHSLQQYRILCSLLTQEKQRNNQALQLLSQTRRLLGEYGKKGQAQGNAFAALERQNKQLMAANQELRAKLEKTLGVVARTTEEQQQTKQQLRQAQSERIEWQIRAEHSEKQLAILQEELHAKKEADEALLAEKRALETQLISYLSIFNKLSWEQKPNTPDPLESLLANIDSLEASFSQRQTQLEGRCDDLIG